VVRASRGGMSRHILDLVATLPRDRYEPCAVIAPDDERIRDALAAIGVAFVPLPMADRLDILADRRTVHALADTLADLRPDLVHLHSNKAALVGTQAIRKLSPRPVTVFTAHNVPSFEKGAWPMRWAGRRALSGIGRDVDRTIAVSLFMAERLITDAGFDARRVDVVYNGVDAAAVRTEVGAADRDAIRGAAGIPVDATVVGTVGRLVRDKGIDTLLRAVASLEGRHDELWTLIVGDGPDEERLRAAAREHLIADRVVFAGFVDDPYPMLAAMDIFALPTLMESFGMAAIEAMAAGLPVVASNVGGIPEVINDDMDGMLVAPGQPAALAAILGCLIVDPSLRGRLSEEAARTAARRFTLPAMAEATAAVYDSALGLSAPRASPRARP
jgi:glycosyltransferase involved in cell wall biosynthesis